MKILKSIIYIVILVLVSNIILFNLERKYLLYNDFFNSDYETNFEIDINSKFLNAIDKKTKYVLIDLGANKGDSIYNFFGMKDQMSNKLPELIDPELVNQVSWTIFAFEANPVFDKDLYRMKQKLSKKHKVNLYNSTAAWIYNGYINFYLDLVNKKDSYWGSSLDNNHPDVVRSGKTKVNVSCVDIAELLLENFNENDFIVVKIDIEGAEYDLLVDFIKKNVLKLIDYIGIEYHNNLLKFNSPNQVFNYILQSNGIKLLKWV